MLARCHTTNKNRPSFGRRKITSTIFVSLKSSSSSLSVSSLPTSSDFFSKKDPRILDPSVVAISLIRGGQQGNDNYYDSKGYQNDSPSSSSSSPSSQQQQYSAGDDFYDDRYGGADDYDDRSFVDQGASVCKLIKKYGKLQRNLFFLFPSFIDIFLHPFLSLILRYT